MRFFDYFVINCSGLVYQGPYYSLPVTFPPPSSVAGAFILSSQSPSLHPSPSSSPSHLFPSSYIWGAVADAKGRRPVIITSCLMVGLSSAVYGFSVNLAMAIVFRFGVGLMNGE